MQQIPMTVRGAQLLREELDYLKNERRPEIIKAIAEAREHGDLKENAEYHAAREQQGFCEGRIQEIEGKLGNSQVIDVTKIPNNGKVIFGATVVLFNTNTDEEVTYRIVGDDEADIKNGLISKPIDFAPKSFAIFRTIPSPDPISTKISFSESAIDLKSLIRSFL